MKSIRILYRNTLVGSIRRCIFSLFNLIYLPNLYSYYQNKLEKIPDGTQVFLMTRGDFGTILVLLNYIRCWEKQRGPTCLVILTYHSRAAIQLAHMVTPQTLIVAPTRRIDRFVPVAFGRMRTHFKTYAQVYARLVIDLPNALYIYQQASTARTNTNYSSYIPHLDRDVIQFQGQHSADFLCAYKKTRRILDYYFDAYKDMISLHYADDLFQRRSFSEEKLSRLKKNLSINTPYVVMNITCRDNPISHNRKKVLYPERFNCVIDYLISLGFSVVIQGRKEQPSFSPRPGLIDYSKSRHCSGENDLLLFSGCDFAIMTKTGPENFGLICNTPVLGLNYVELASMQPHAKMRYYPKHIRHSKTGQFVKWEELLQASYFFDIGTMKFNNNLEYVDMEEDELLSAVKEFIPLVKQSPKEWSSLSPLQQKFKSQLSPLHLDLFLTQSTPCNSYLSSTKFSPPKNLS